MVEKLLLIALTVLLVTVVSVIFVFFTELTYTLYKKLDRILSTYCQSLYLGLYTYIPGGEWP